jgi:hypothetical protein
LVVLQHPVKFFYDKAEGGDYVADLLDDGQILVGLKTIRALDNIHKKARAI